MTESPVWHVLGIAPTDDREVIRRAYTRKLKVTNPEDDAAAFQRLREAYEGALQFAALGFAFVAPDESDDANEPAALPDVDVPARVPFSRTPESPAGSSLSPTVLELREDYSKLVALLDRDDPGVEALQVFTKICASPALDDVSLRLELETSIAALLIQHMPKSSELVSRAARAFGWSTHQVRIGSAPAIQIAAKCAEDVAFVRELQAGGHPRSAAFRALTTRPIGWLLRVRILLSGLDTQVSELQRTLMFERASAGAVLNEDAVEWWNRYFAKPRLSRAMVLTSLAAPVLTAWLTNGPLEWSGDRVRRAVWVAALAMVAATAAKLFVLDWGRVRFHERFGDGMPPWLALGWLPVMILLAIMAGLGVALWPLSALCVVWAWYSRPDPGFGRRSPSVPLKIYFNLPLVAWLGLLATALPWTVVLTLACIAATHISGQTTLANFWLSDVSAAVRAKAVAALLVVAVVLGAALVVNAHDELYGLLAALALVVVLLQRTAVQVLTEGQLHLRYYITWASLFGVGIGLANLDAAGVAVVLTSSWFLFGTAVGLFMALNNDIRSARSLRRN